MLLWNKNPEYRKEYVRCNLRSTAESLGMLDGRSLAPDEKAVTMSNNVYLSVDVRAKPTQPNRDNVEEERLANKEELERLINDGIEKRKLLTEAALREQRRLEEKSKALEALMRKKKIAEKTQMRAEIRAQKEAQEKMVSRLDTKAACFVLGT